MKSTKFLVAAAILILLVVVGVWWFQKKRAEEQTARAAMILREPPSDTSRKAPPPRELEPSSSAPKPTVVATEEGSFTVQISAWRSNSKAESEAQRFQRAGYAAFVQRAYIPELGGVWYRVRVGQFNTREAAEQQAQELEMQLDAGYWITHKQ